MKMGYMCVQWNWISPVLLPLLPTDEGVNKWEAEGSRWILNINFHFKNWHLQTIHGHFCFTTATALLLPFPPVRPHRPELPNRVRKMSYLVVPLPVGTGALGPPSCLSTGVVAIYFGATFGLALWVWASRAPTRHNLALTSPQSAPSSTHASTSPWGWRG